MCIRDSVQAGRSVRAEPGVLHLGEGVGEEALRERLVEGEPSLADLIDGDDHGGWEKRARTVMTHPIPCQSQGIPGKSWLRHPSVTRSVAPVWYRRAPGSTFE